MATIFGIKIRRPTITEGALGLGLTGTAIGWPTVGGWLWGLGGWALGGLGQGLTAAGNFAIANGIGLAGIGHIAASVPFLLALGPAATMVVGALAVIAALAVGAGIINAAVKTFQHGRHGTVPSHSPDAPGRRQDKRLSIIGIVAAIGLGILFLPALPGIIGGILGFIGAQHALLIGGALLAGVLFKGSKAGDIADNFARAAWSHGIGRTALGNAIEHRVINPIRGFFGTDGNAKSMVHDIVAHKDTKTGKSHDYTETEIKAKVHDLPDHALAKARAAADNIVNHGNRHTPDEVELARRVQTAVQQERRSRAEGIA